MQDRTSANSMKVLLQRAAGPYIGSNSDLLRCPLKCPVCPKAARRFMGSKVSYQTEGFLKSPRAKNGGLTCSRTLVLAGESGAPT
jgi:hypothetical protein